MSNPVKQFYEFGDFRLDAENGELWRGGAAVTLPRKAFETLHLLVAHSSQLLTKDELMEQLWPGSFVEEAGLTQLIYLLRKALAVEGEEARKWIVTVPGRGYRFAAEVRRVEAAPLVIETHSVTRVVIEATDTEDDTQELPAPPAAAPALPSALGTVASGWNRQVRWGAVGLTLLALAGLGFGVYEWRGRRQERRAAAAVRVRPLTSFPGRESEPRFSADGKQVAFVWDGAAGDNTDIYVKLIGADSMLRLTHDAANDHSPAWSPDGTQLAFLRRRGEHDEVLLVAALGGAERKLGEVALGNEWRNYAQGGLAWSPGGEWLALIDTPPTGGHNSVFLLSVKTGEKRQLTQPPAVSFGDMRPAFAPDGRTLAFARSTNSLVENLFVLPLTAELTAGGAERQLTAHSGSMYDLAWTPVGDALFYTVQTGGTVRLHRLAAAGGTPEQVSALASEAYEITLARQANDSLLLVYSQRDRDYNIWRAPLVSLDSPVAPALLIASSRADTNPRYAPDGRHIAFSSQRTGNWEIWVTDEAGGNAVRLTYFNGAPNGTPRWSPDSQWLAFDARVEGNSDLYVIKADGGSPPRRLTTEPSSETTPSWSRDGQRIYFCSNRSGTRQLWQMPVTGGAARQLTQGGGFEGEESYADGDSPVFYYARRSLPGIFALRGVNGTQPLSEQSIAPLQSAGTDRYWALSPQGIYYLAPPAQIHFYDFATHQTRLVLTLPATHVNGGFHVAPDGRWLLYVQAERPNGDLSLVEGLLTPP